MCRGFYSVEVSFLCSCLPFSAGHISSIEAIWHNGRSTFLKPNKPDSVLKVSIHPSMELLVLGLSFLIYKMVCWGGWWGLGKIIVWDSTCYMVRNVCYCFYSWPKCPSQTAVHCQLEVKKLIPNLTCLRKGEIWKEKRKQCNINLNLIFSTSLTLLLLFLESPNHFCRIIF